MVVSAALSTDNELDHFQQQQRQQQQLTQQSLLQIRSLHEPMVLPANATHVDSAVSASDAEDQHDWTFMKADPVLSSLQLPAKRAAWTRRLVVTKQPASEFYKDEGGKSNALDVEVTLAEFDANGEPARSPDDDFVELPLRILLFFESGKRVDDTDQEIFRFVGNDYDSVVIRRHSRKASVQFRLEKVSRRKDGQRFKLRIEVDQEQCTANVSDLTPVFTNAICVLSKRKHHNACHTDTSVRVKEPAPKLIKRDLVKLEEKLGSKIDTVLTEMARMGRQLQKQNELIARLCAPIPATATLSSSCDLASFEWLLKSTLGDDDDDASPATWSLSHPNQQNQQNQQQQANAMLGAYLAASDSAYEFATQLSPSASSASSTSSSSSSDLSVVEILPTSPAFASF